MEQSSTHGPRLDDELAHESKGPTDDVRPVPDDRRGNPAGMTQDDVDRRSEIARHLGTSAFPGTRDSLVATAASHHAPEAVLAELARLPHDERFVNVQDVVIVLGHGVETRRP